MYIFTETRNFNSNKNTNAYNDERQQVPTHIHILFWVMVRVNCKKK
jgi:hypothetical protein